MPHLPVNAHFPCPVSVLPPWPGDIVGQEVSAKADEMITLGKKGGLANYRAALEYITKEDVAKKVFSTIAPQYAEVDGGYTQIYKQSY